MKRWGRLHIKDVPRTASIFEHLSKNICQRESIVYSTHPDQSCAIARPQMLNLKGSLLASSFSVKYITISLTRWTTSKIDCINRWTLCANCRVVVSTYQWLEIVFTMRYRLIKDYGLFAFELVAEITGLDLRCSFSLFLFPVWCHIQPYPSFRFLGSQWTMIIIFILCIKTLLRRAQQGFIKIISVIWSLLFSPSFYLLYFSSSSRSEHSKKK